MALKKPAANAAQETEETNDAIEGEVVETETTATAEPVAETAPEAEKTEAASESATSTSTEVATQSNTTTAMAPAGMGGSVHEEGFAEVDLGFGAFPMITLPGEGVFMLDDEDIGKEVNGQIMGSRLKFVYRNSDDEDTVEFSYDEPKKVPEEKRVNAAGHDLKPILDQWRAEGADVEMKTYLECPFMITEGDHEGEMAMLSIAPASVQKFEGYRVQLNFRGKSVKDVVTTVYVGAKVTKAKKPFYPWAFKEAK